MKINERPSVGMMRVSNPGSAREQVASPPAGTALAPRFGNASRTASEWTRFDAICNRNRDDRQRHSDITFSSLPSLTRCSSFPAIAGGRGTTRRVVEGAWASTFLRRHTKNCICNIVNVCHQFARRDADYRYTPRLEPFIAFNVALRPISHVVSDAIEFDRKPGFGTIKVENVGADRMLPSKSRLARQSRAQPAP